MSIVQLALKRPYTFIVMAMLIVLATPFALLNMATDIFPEINIPVISIIWNYNGLPATEMGNRISAQNERSLTTTVSDIEHLESTSLAGYGVVKDAELLALGFGILRRDVHPIGDPAEECYHSPTLPPSSA